MSLLGLLERRRVLELRHLAPVDQVLQVGHAPKLSEIGGHEGGPKSESMGRDEHVERTDDEASLLQINAQVTGRLTEALGGIRFAGTAKQYSIKAMPHDARIATIIGAWVNFRCPYHANVMKILERQSRTIGTNGRNDAGMIIYSMPMIRVEISCMKFVIADTNAGNRTKMAAKMVRILGTKTSVIS